MKSIILYNDDEHDMLEVSELIEKATGCDAGRSTQIMLEAHKTGRAVVWTGDEQECGRLVSQFKGAGLNVKVI